MAVDEIREIDRDRREKLDKLNREREQAESKRSSAEREREEIRRRLRDPHLATDEKKRLAQTERKLEEKLHTYQDESVRLSKAFNEKWKKFFERAGEAPKAEDPKETQRKKALSDLQDNIPKVSTPPDAADAKSFRKRLAVEDFKREHFRGRVDAYWATLRDDCFLRLVQSENGSEKNMEVLQKALGTDLEAVFAEWARTSTRPDDLEALGRTIRNIRASVDEKKAVLYKLGREATAAGLGGKNDAFAGAAQELEFGLDLVTNAIFANLDEIKLMGDLPVLKDLEAQALHYRQLTEAAKREAECHGSPQTFWDQNAKSISDWVGAELAPIRNRETWYGPLSKNLDVTQKLMDRFDKAIDVNTVGADLIEELKQGLDGLGAALLDARGRINSSPTLGEHIAVRDRALDVLSDVAVVFAQGLDRIARGAEWLAVGADAPDLLNDLRASCRDIRFRYVDRVSPSDFKTTVQRAVEACASATDYHEYWKQAKQAAMDRLTDLGQKDLADALNKRFSRDLGSSLDRFQRGLDEPEREKLLKRVQEATWDIQSYKSQVQLLLQELDLKNLPARGVLIDLYVALDGMIVAMADSLDAVAGLAD